MRLNRFSAFLAMLFLVACQQAPIRDENSPFMRIAPGSVIVLHQALTVSLGHARVFMQNGKVVGKTQLNQYYPHCDFETQSVSKGKLQIEPDRFTVTAVKEDETQLVRRWQPLHRAAWHVNGGSGGGYMMLTRYVEHTLESPRQPQVMRLTCYGGFSDPWEVAYPTVTEIRHVLGDIATIELAGN